MLRLLLVLLSVLLVSPPGIAQDSGLRVELSADRDAVENFGKITINVRIVNAGFSDETIQFWRCSFDDSWIADNPVVIIEARPCKNNPLEKITLKPGEVYENADYPLIVSVNVPAEEITSEGVTFRLGFKTDVLQKQDTSLPPAWSEPLTVKITQ